MPIHSGAVKDLCSYLTGGAITHTIHAVGMSMPPIRHMTLTAKVIDHYSPEEIQAALSTTIQTFYMPTRQSELSLPAIIEGLRLYATDHKKEFKILMGLLDKAGMDFVRTLIAKHQALFDTIVVSALCQDETIELMPTLMHLGQADKARLFKLTGKSTTFGHGTFGIYASFYCPSKNPRANARTELIESLYQSKGL